MKQGWKVNDIPNTLHYFVSSKNGRQYVGRTVDDRAKKYKKTTTVPVLHCGLGSFVERHGNSDLWPIELFFCRLTTITHCFCLFWLEPEIRTRQVCEVIGYGTYPTVAGATLRIWSGKHLTVWAVCLVLEPIYVHTIRSSGSPFGPRPNPGFYTYIFSDVQRSSYILVDLVWLSNILDCQSLLQDTKDYLDLF